MRDVAREIVPTDVDSAVRLVQFLGVGLLGAVVDNGVLFMLVEFAAFEPVVGAFISKEVSITTMFVVNYAYTFDDAPAVGRRGILWRYVKSNGARWIGAGVGIGVLYLLTRYFGVWYILANVIGIGVGFVVNYVLESLVTFRIHRR